MRKSTELLASSHESHSDTHKHTHSHPKQGHNRPRTASSRPDTASPSSIDPAQALSIAAELAAAAHDGAALPDAEQEQLSARFHAMIEQPAEQHTIQNPLKLDGSLDQVCVLCVCLVVFVCC